MDRNLKSVTLKNSDLRRTAEGPTGLEGRTPPGWLLDKWAEEKRAGGFVLKRENLCPECHTYRSRNGSCLCG